MNPSLEHMVEAATIKILQQQVEGILFLHYEHTTTDHEGKPTCIVKLERGAPEHECFHRSDLMLHVIGASDWLHREIDEAIGSRYGFASELVDVEPRVAVRNNRGFGITRSSDNNIYTRTYTTEIEVAYSNNQ